MQTNLGNFDEEISAHIWMQQMCPNCAACRFFREGNCQNPSGLGFVCHDERLCYEDGNIPIIQNLRSAKING